MTPSKSAAEDIREADARTTFPGNCDDIDVSLDDHRETVVSGFTRKNICEEEVCNTIEPLFRGPCVDGVSGIWL